MECICGVSNSDTTKFCTGCGVAVNNKSKPIPENIKNCHSCSATLKNGALFCNKCGTKCSLQEVVLKNVEVPVIDPVSNNLQCKFCNAELTQNAKFCLNCGKSCLTSEITPPVVQSSIKSESKTLLSDLPIETPRENLQLDSAEAKIKGKSNLTLITILSVSAISIGLVSWLGFNEFQKTKIAATTSKPLPPQVTPPNEPNIETQQVEESAISTGLVSTPATATEPTSTPTSVIGQAPSSKYIGKIIKHGTIVDNYAISLVGKSGAFKVFSAYDSDDAGIFVYTKFILIADQTGKVITSQESFDKDSILVDSKSACVINNKPYIGAFALSSTTKELSIPSAVWQINETGKLIVQNLNGIKCGVYLKFEDESDSVESVTGYNDLPKSKPSAQKQPKVITSIKKTQSQQNSSAIKPAPIENNNKPLTPIVQQPEVTSNQPQEIIKTEEPKSKPLNTLGGLFEKIGGSIPKGEENHICTSSERAMNQCQ